MKATVKIKQEVELKTLHVEAGVRHWEDTDVNGEADTEDGSNIPCKEGDMWKPVIDLNTGKILNWQVGKTANVHYKVCDSGSYFLKDEHGTTVLSINENYVPEMMCPAENGYGDYIIMNIDENGIIDNWEPSLSGFDDQEED